MFKNKILIQVLPSRSIYFNIHSAETDEKPIKATMEIVHQLFSNGELKQAHMLRERVLEKCQNRQLMQQQKTNKSLFSSYQVTAK